MPYQNVMPKFGKGMLRSGSKAGPKVKDPKQAIAIMLSEKKKGTIDTGPSDSIKKKFKPFVKKIKPAEKFKPFAKKNLFAK